jgi:tetratricopeptide (TPR) repeat protein
VPTPGPVRPPDEQSLAHRPSLGGRLDTTEILASARAGRTVIEDFRPVAESLEWDLGQRAWHELGSRAFTGEPVPFVVHNDGNLSMRCAEVLFANLTEAEQAGELEPDIFVLELGIGVGLFARFFLDAFRDLCDRGGKDYYDRLTYVAADRSERMLLDAGRNGIFLNHPGRYVLRVGDALRPDRIVLLNEVAGERKPGPFRAVFLNYLLDCLPFTVLRLDQDEVRQLFVRTCLAQPGAAAPRQDSTADGLKRLAASSDPASLRELIAVYSQLIAEFEYRPVGVEEVPHGEFAVELTRSAGSRFMLHSYGAMQSLDSLLGLLHEGGFILVNDYGQTEWATEPGFEHQRFSDTTAVAVNFHLLKSWLSSRDGVRWEEPEEDKPSGHARLISNAVGPATVTCFREQFGKGALTRLEEATNAARELARTGRLEAALSAYRQVLDGQPLNWALRNEVARFLLSGFGSPAAGVEMAKAGLELNPSCSAELWNTLGDCLYACGRREDSRFAFLRALRINPDDVQARYNLAFVQADAGEYTETLVRIGEALALDKAGSLREVLLRKQSEVLARGDQRWQQRFRVLANRVSHRLAAKESS